MNVFSAFNGMNCGRLALEEAEIQVDSYFSSEIDVYCNEVTNMNHPDTIQLGDICQIKGEQLPSIDLMFGGSPCTALSFAGKGSGFDDPRSKLFFEFVRLLKEIKPKFWLFENVVMRKDSEKVITDLLGVNPIFINSSTQTAQNRKRLYWTNIPNITQPEDKGIVWNDIKEVGEEFEWYHYVKDGERRFAKLDFPFEQQAIAAMRGRYLIDDKRQDGKQLTAGLTQQYIEFRYDGKSNALTTVQKDNVVVPFTLDRRIPVKEFFYRYMTPLECERLQGVREGYTDCASTTQRLKMLGNGWTVPVIAHILKHVR